MNEGMWKRIVGRDCGWLSLSLEDSRRGGPLKGVDATKTLHSRVTSRLARLGSPLLIPYPEPSLSCTGDRISTSMRDQS